MRTLDVQVADPHLANLAVAVASLLASEAQAFSLVTGDERQLRIQLALADRHAQTRVDAEAWARWALHNAGVRGVVRTGDPVGEADRKPLA